MRDCHIRSTQVAVMRGKKILITTIIKSTLQIIVTLILYHFILDTRTGVHCYGRCPIKPEAALTFLWPLTKGTPSIVVQDLAWPPPHSSLPRIYTYCVYKWLNIGLSKSSGMPRRPYLYYTNFNVPAPVVRLCQ